MREHAAAKINLYLHVVGRRDDGYHLLDSVVIFAGAADRLSVTSDPALRLSLTGPFAAVLQADAGDNLVLRAAARLRGDTNGAGAHLTLDKQLPVASGIGGGSADAAAALRLLRQFWECSDFDPEALHRLAASLGADVPVCLAGRPARMQGVGEILLEAPTLPDRLGLVLVNCGEAVSTPSVFRARDPGFRPAAMLPRGWDDAQALAASLSGLSNDLEVAARRLCPAIDGVLDWLRALPGCRFARMSGSGATCFGLFDDADAARQALGAAEPPETWWVWAGGCAPEQDQV